MYAWFMKVFLGPLDPDASIGKQNIQAKEVYEVFEMGITYVCVFNSF